jgi:hypothetical protein
MENDLSNNQINNIPDNTSTSMETIRFFEQMLSSSTNRRASMIPPNILTNRNHTQSPFSRYINDHQNYTTSTYVSNNLNNTPIDMNNDNTVDTSNNVIHSVNNVINDINNVINNANDISNNLTDPDAEAYIRFFEDILQLPPLTSTNRIRTLLETSLDEKPKYKYVLSAEGEASIKIVIYDPNVHGNIKCCPITQINFTKDDPISQLPCDHLFDTNAILKWLKEEKAECPICRSKLKSYEKKIEFKTPLSPPTDLSGNRNLITENIRFRNTHPFGPHRARRRSQYNFNRLLVSRQTIDEEEELQAALIASLEEEYMPEYNAQQPTASDEDDND